MPQNELPRNVRVYDNNVPEGQQSIFIAWIDDRESFTFVLNLSFNNRYHLTFIYGVSMKPFYRDDAIVSIQDYYVISVGGYYISIPNDELDHQLTLPSLSLRSRRL